MKQWYQTLFENYADHYEQESFTKGTLAEVDFIVQELGPNRRTRILDLGCGTGRHAIELAQRGYQVTGLDLSAAQLARARTNAQQAGMRVPLVRADARQFAFRRQFNAVIMVCEGAFPLMETDEMNFTILQNAAQSLAGNGKFIFTTLNGLFPLFHSVKEFINSHSERDTSLNNSFDLMTFRDHSEYEHEDDAGKRRVLTCNERYYVPSEITWLLKSLGFRQIDILGCEIGKWDRAQKLTTEHFEMLVVAEK